MKISEVTPFGTIKETTVHAHVYETLQDYLMGDSLTNLMHQFSALVDTLTEKGVLNLEDVVELTSTYKELRKG